MPTGVYEGHHGRQPTLSNRQDQLVAKLYLAGLSLTEVGELYDLSRKAIRKSLIRTNTPVRPKYIAGFGPKNPAWKGGRTSCKEYVLIRKPDHPNASTNGYVPEHRLVVETSIGRYLHPKEVVHHKNKNKSDNRLENLVLFASNGDHLAVDLFGKVPKWTEEGKKRIAERRIPSMAGNVHSSTAPGVRRLRKKLIQKFRHEISAPSDTGQVASLPPLPPLPKRRPKKEREKA